MKMVTKFSLLKKYVQLRNHPNPTFSQLQTLQIIAYELYKRHVIDLDNALIIEIGV